MKTCPLEWYVHLEGNHFYSNDHKIVLTFARQNLLQLERLKRYYWGSAMTK